MVEEVGEDAMGLQEYCGNEKENWLSGLKSMFLSIKNLSK